MFAITAATGRVGGAAVRTLLEAGHAVRVIGASAAPHRFSQPCLGLPLLELCLVHGRIARLLTSDPPPIKPTVKAETMS